MKNKAASDWERWETWADEEREHLQKQLRNRDNPFILTIITEIPKPLAEDQIITFEIKQSLSSRVLTCRTFVSVRQVDGRLVWRGGLPGTPASRLQGDDAVIWCAEQAYENWH